MIILSVSGKKHLPLSDRRGNNNRTATYGENKLGV